ncbi:glycine--tRNA ligase subunit beta [Palleronia sediminis]|uniref:Glycine--tRNA ligase beta subunit n=1 Tax=Palleronia sediminis TaxID=2547833 RepID=A0A4R6A7W9_9RHOB|nr:glycine--tRNA ligase subunit beta [Palleronia sediminis]TDL79800.1 glycine--tRNA ligase subunit beta [Palleronia sediminis]
MADLLIELFSEEIPARMQARAAEDLRRLFTEGIVEAGLTYAHAGAYVTPRRLTLTVEGLAERSPDTVEDRRGPKLGAPDKAVEGFARGAGVAVADLELRDDKKGQVYFATIRCAGRTAPEIVAEVLERTIRDFPWPKSMRWGRGALRWVRPLHRILCVLSREDGHEVVPLVVDGIAAGDLTEGHRFMSPGPIRVSGHDDYAARLRRAHVMLDPAERAEHIRNDAANQAFAQGLELVEDAALLAEVAGLVEWPVVLMGRIDDAFLSLPPEVLQTSMREHQKFFSVRDPGDGRIVGFVTVANRETADGGATILAGNRRVLSARLADAAFFWENDLAVARAGMTKWTDSLSQVTFHARLGTEADRVARIAALARELAPSVGADPDLAEEAARICKADLVSEMVYEFPELQGVMGRYYAEAAGRPAEVAEAVAEHYAPLGPSDAVPSAPVSVTVSLAEKIDKLAGFWAIGETPTGSKDPYALRRAALGVIRLVLDNGLRLPLDRIFAENSGPLLAFFHDRLKVHLRDEGIRHDVIDACLAMTNADDLTLLVKRARAVQGFLDSDAGGDLVQLYRRANNILTQAEEADGVEYSFGADVKHAETDEERALFAALATERPRIEAALGAEDFGAAMAALARLRDPIDAFFEAVQINTDAQITRRNRLNLLADIRNLCVRAADLSRIEG